MTDSLQQINQPWARSRQEILEAMSVSREQGLDASEVQRRRKRHGSNRLRRAEQKGGWRILVEQFQSPIVLLLAVAAAFSFLFGDWVEGLAIVAALLINTGIGFLMEYRAVRAMEALQELTRVETKVLRGGRLREVPAEELVLGDIVHLEGGDVVTADLRLLESSKLQANESTLTGESVPVGKGVEPLKEDTPLAERSNMVFKGTAVTRGSGQGVVVATGMDTELGQISSLVEEASEEATPLEKRLGRLGQRLLWITLAIGAVVVVGGIIAGKEFFLMVETGIALAVASIPEGLPIVATIALARGMWRMARRQAIVNHLSAVETLGSTTVILTDKTGTLTENQMTARRYLLPSGEVEVTGEGLEVDGEFQRDGSAIDPAEQEILRRALEVGVLCNNSSFRAEEGQTIGDPTEVALLVSGAKAGLHRDQLLERMPEAREVAFDPQVKMMATYHERDGRYRVAVKGAPEAVLEVSSHILTPEGEQEMSDQEREQWQDRGLHMAEQGLRVIALASKQVRDVESEPYRDLTFLGMAGLLDPAREEVRPAITSCKRAGIGVVMVTGDQSATAHNIASAVQLVEGQQVETVHGRELRDIEELSQQERERLLRARIFARVDPKQKLDLIALFQDAGEVVAMTGDGVNDAPALKKADIGVAMGQRGTQVAKEAADMVLKDDAFTTIVVAIEQGRVIFNNIRKFVLYLLSCNMAEVLVVGGASLVNAPLPIRPLQILYLNLLTDVFPALALGVGEGDLAIMERPPRDPSEPILSRSHWLAIGGYGTVITLSVLGGLAVSLLWLGMEQRRAVTISFLILAFAQLWHVFNMRDRGTHLVRNEVVQNRYVWGALVLCVGLLLAGVYLPVLSAVLGTVDPGTDGWLLTIGMSLIPLLVGQVFKHTGSLLPESWR